MSYTHGTQYGYRSKGCKCAACKAWFAGKSRAYRQRRKARTGERILHGKFVKPEAAE